MLSFVDCAKRGRPTGGPKDSIPPIIVRSVPENFTTNFTGDEIRIYFDEYIKLKDLSKNLLISPPLEVAPLITPLSSSKMLKVKFNDTLRANTTYSINFGNSIEDNNENNTLTNYKYVFSTGSFIDSLKVTGRITDALSGEVKKPVSIMLYEKNVAYTDSLIFTQKPSYVTMVQDSTNTFELTNIKEGNYLLIALQEENRNYTYQPKTDKIGFIESDVTLPTDKTYDIAVFKEIPIYSLARPKQESQNRITFGYEGAIDSLDIQLLTSAPRDYKNRIIKEYKKDSLQYWYAPSFEQDSLVFRVQKNSVTDTVTVRIKELYKDSLRISQRNTTVLRLKDSVVLEISTPLMSLDKEKMMVTDKDTLAIAFEARLYKRENTAVLYFDKKEEQTYTLNILPKAFTDFFGNTNDSLRFNYRTKLLSDYGTINVTLQNLNDQDAIVQIVSDTYEVVQEVRLSKEAAPKAYFESLNPANYYIRIIIDTNTNGIWDTGDFLNRTDPEKVIYYPVQIELKSNWSLEETFILE
jgi:uncharacterized protein (DUF2141 family)